VQWKDFFLSLFRSMFFYLSLFLFVSNGGPWQAVNGVGTWGSVSREVLACLLAQLATLWQGRDVDMCDIMKRSFDTNSSLFRTSLALLMYANI
jgi:hypothetical protein